MASTAQGGGSRHGGDYFLRRYSLISATMPTVRPMAIAAVPASISGTAGITDCVRGAGQRRQEPDKRGMQKSVFSCLKPHSAR